MRTATSHAENLPPPPEHVAIIMDGNGRWARARGLPRIEGHRRGAAAVRIAVESAVKYGVRYLTIYGFSSENWKRPAGEVTDLMALLRRYLRSEIAELRQNDVRVRFIGDRGQLHDDIVRLIEEAEASTALNTALNLTVALSYGGRAEITSAVRRLAEDIRAGRLNPEDIDEHAFARHLATADLPDPDLLIRTSGEMRISNFLLWQLAYAEFVFPDVLWPDFSEQNFADAIAEFQRRDRRYGATGG